MDLEIVYVEQTYASFVHVLVELRTVEVRVVACGRLYKAKPDPQPNKTFRVRWIENVD